MKDTLLLSTFFFLLLSCKQDETTYSVNCDFGIGEYNIIKRVLVVTNAQGEVFETFDIANSAASLNRQFSVSEKKPPEQYDLHLVNVELGDIIGADTFYRIRVFSHLDVLNGALVNFKPEPVGGSSPWRVAHLKIYGIESPDSLDLVGLYRYYLPEFFPSEKRLDCSVQFPSNQSLLLRLRANNEPDFRYCFIPDTLVSDTMSVAWQDLKPETNLKHLELPGGLTENVRIHAVSPDFMHHTVLYNTYQWSNGGIQSPVFNFPEGIAEPANYYVYALQNTGSFEQIIQPGEPLRLVPSDMEIGDFSFARHRISIETSGDIDLLRSEVSAFLPGEEVYEIFWRMEGSKTALQDHALPGLGEYLPSWFSQPSYHRVTALQFEKFNYAEVREGFPFKSNEPFAVARSGHKAIWKFK